MHKPILSREEVEDILASAGIDFRSRGLIEGTEEDLYKGVAALESAILEKLCGEPIYQVWIEETSSYADVTAEYYAERLPSNRRIVFALNRSKS